MASHSPCNDVLVFVEFKGLDRFFFPCAGMQKDSIGQIVAYSVHSASIGLPFD